MFVFILNLALADFSLAVVVVVVANLRYIQMPHSDGCVDLDGLGFYIFSIGMLTLDR